MDCESIPVGTVFGHGASNLPGATVLIRNDIAMSVDILRVGSFVGFNEATVGGSYAALFDTTP